MNQKQQMFFFHIVSLLHAKALAIRLIRFIR